MFIFKIIQSYLIFNNITIFFILINKLYEYKKYSIIYNKKLYLNYFVMFKIIFNKDTYKSLISFGYGFKCFYSFKTQSIKTTYFFIESYDLYYLIIITLILFQLFSNEIIGNVI